MKTLINKLFKWLGYVPKREYYEILDTNKDLQVSVNWHDMATDDIHFHNVKYDYEDLFGYVMVTSTTKDTSDHCVGFPIKRFEYYDEKGREFALLCAEELCEMLNDKV